MLLEFFKLFKHPNAHTLQLFDLPTIRDPPFGCCLSALLVIEILSKVIDTIEIENNTTFKALKLLERKLKEFV